MNVAWQHVHSRVPAPSSRVKGIPNEIDELVVAATDSDPTGRPADGGIFLAEVADLRTELGLPVAPIPARPRRPGTDPRDARARASTEVLGQQRPPPARHRGGVAPTGAAARTATTARRRRSSSRRPSSVRRAR